MDQAARGATALSAGRFEEAIEEYTAAISINPNSPDYFIKRSTAYQRSKPPQLELALSDADNAVLLAMKRAKRELIAEAQMRRATILFSLERYADAQFVLGLVKKLNEKEKTLQIWEAKIQMKLKDLPDGDKRAIVTVSEVPSLRTTEGPKAAATEPKLAPAVVPTPPSKIKQDWYQSIDSVTLTLLAKGVPKDKASIEMHERSLAISFPTIVGSTYEYTLDPLYAPIIPEDSSYNITTHKVEVILKKKTPGQKWHSLEGDPTVQSPTTQAAECSTDAAIKQAVLSHDKAPAYPTSSKSGPKDWDKLADDLTRKPKAAAKKDGGSEEPDDKDDGLEDDEGDPAAAFFKKLYKNADPDTRRAMMKSYQESNGTVLSTNWQDVGARTIETQPPDGMEAKKW